MFGSRPSLEDRSVEPVFVLLFVDPKYVDTDSPERLGSEGPDVQYVGRVGVEDESTTSNVRHFQSLYETQVSGPHPKSIGLTPAPPPRRPPVPIPTSSPSKRYLRLPGG